jgi:hypothetical protein
MTLVYMPWSLEPIQSICRLAE